MTSKSRKKAGASVKAAPKAKAISKASAKPAKGASVKRAATAAISGASNKWLGFDIVDVGQTAMGMTKGSSAAPKEKSSSGKKRRRGKVPKTVRKWATKFISRRKTEEKIVKGIFGADGGKVIKKPKATKSYGVITQQEAMNALRR